MKSRKEVTFIEEQVYDKPYSVSYSVEPFEGATVFKYQWRHKGTGTIGKSVLYGVSPENGRRLLDKWNLAAKKEWEYIPYIEI